MWRNWQERRPCTHCDQLKEHRKLPIPSLLTSQDYFCLFNFWKFNFTYFSYNYHNYSMFRVLSMAQMKGNGIQILWSWSATFAISASKHGGQLVNVFFIYSEVITLSPGCLKGYLENFHNDCCHSWTKNPFKNLCIGLYNYTTSHEEIVSPWDRNSSAMSVLSTLPIFRTAWTLMSVNKYKHKISKTLPMHCLAGSLVSRNICYKCCRSQIEF